MPVQPYSAPFAPSQPAGQFFKGVDFTDSDSLTKAIGAGVSSQGQQGANLTKMGSDALGPIFARLMKLMSGDESTINQAVQPQIRSIVDAYDAARKTTAQFTPRGGGSAASQTKSRFSEASDIAGVRSNAITGATKDLQSLGTSLLSAGTQEQASNLQSLFALLQNAKQDEHATRDLWTQVGIHAGKIAAAYFTSGASVAAIGI